MTSAMDAGSAGRTHWLRIQLGERYVKAWREACTITDRQSPLGGVSCKSASYGRSSAPFYQSHSSRQLVHRRRPGQAGTVLDGLAVSRGPGSASATTVATPKACVKASRTH